MSGAQSTFETVLTAKDTTGPVIARMQGEVARAASRMGELGAVTQRLGLAGIFGKAQQGIAGASGAVRAMTSEVGMLGSRLVSIVPALAGLTGLASAGGIFKLTADVAEAAEKSRNLAGALNLSTSELGKFRFLAKHAGTDSDALGVGLARLSRGIFAAATGQDKTLARTFHSVGVSLRDGRGEIRSLAEVSEDLFKVFEVNSPKAHQFLAKAFFGKGGGSMLALFKRLPQEERAQLLAVYKTLKPEMSEEEGAKAGNALHSFRREWLTLDAAASSFKGQLATALAPQLTPLLIKMREFITGHREGIIEAASGGIIGGLKWIDGWWTKHRSGLLEMSAGINRVATALGGWEPIMLSLSTLMAGRFVLTIVGGLTRITGLAWLAGAALRGVTAAVGSAAVGAAGGSAVGAGTAAVGGAVAGRALPPLASLALRWGGPAAAFLYMMRPRSTVTWAEELAGIRESERRMDERMFTRKDTPGTWMERTLPRIAYNTPRPAGFDGPIVPPGGEEFYRRTHPELLPVITGPQSLGKVDVRVTLTGAPPGTKVESDATGAAKVTVRLGGTGEAFGSMP